MKKFLFITLLIIVSNFAISQGVAISSDGLLSEPDGSAVLDVKSTNSGVLIPRITQSQRDAILSPATGLVIYQTDNNSGFYYNSGTPAFPVWQRMALSGETLSGSGIATRLAFWTGSTTLSSNENLFWNNTFGRLGIGTANPAVQLHTTGTVRFANYASGGNGAILRTNHLGDLVTTNLTGSASDVLLGNGTFGSIPSDTYATLSNGAGITTFSYNGTAATTVGLATTGVTAGTYTNANVSVNAYGQITAASSGSGGGISMGCAANNYILKRSNATTTTCSQLYDNGTTVQIGANTITNSKFAISYSNTDLYGIYVTMPGTAIYANAAGGVGRGVIGSGGETGIMGSLGNYTSSNTWGKLGFYENTPTYYGAYGYSFDSHSSGSNFGVRGRAGNNSNKNVGVFADVGSMSVGNYNYGVYADACGPNYAYGVYASAHDCASGKGYAVYADGQDFGVYAISYARASGNAAVYGRMASGTGTTVYQGIRGEAEASTSAYDVRGITGLGDGGSHSGTIAYGVKGHAQKAATCYGIYGSASGTGTNYAGYFTGNVSVIGALTKGSGSFLIDHPLDPLNKTLRHNFVESPENLLIYRGKVTLNQNGVAKVKMPDYFIALTKEDGALVQLTPIGRGPFLTSYEWEANSATLTIYGKAEKEVSWQVTADRDDPVIRKLYKPVEEEKGNGNFEKGKILYPEAYGYPETMGVNYESKQQSLNSETNKAEEMFNKK